MSETSVASDLLHSLKIVSELCIQLVGDELRPVAVSDISLSVQEPLGDVVVYTEVRNMLRSEIDSCAITYQLAWRGYR
jgi:hypothetical protein